MSQEEQNVARSRAGNKSRKKPLFQTWVLAGAPVVAACVVLGLISLLDVDATVSQTENRALAQMPEFSWRALLDGSYTRAWDAYYADTFPLRDEFFALTGQIKRLQGISDASGATLVVGSGSQDGEKDLGIGEAILPGDLDFGPMPTLAPTAFDPTPPSDIVSTPAPTNTPAPTPTPSPTPMVTPTPPPMEGSPVNGVVVVGTRAMEIFYRVEQKLVAYGEILSRMASAMPDVQVYSLVAPISSEFYAPEAYRKSANSQKLAIEQINSALNGVTAVNAYDVLEAHQSEELYFRTDHHWTALGAYYAYTAFCQSAGIEPVALSDYQSGTIDGFVGSLYREVATSSVAAVLKNNPDTLAYYTPFTPHEAWAYTSAAMTNGYRVPVVSASIVQNTTNKYLCFLSGDYPLIHIRSQSGTGRKIIVIKESYGNAFVPFLLPHYDEVFVVDPRSLSDMDLAEFARAQDVDEVLVLNYTFATSNASYQTNLKKLLD